MCCSHRWTELMPFGFPAEGSQAFLHRRDISAAAKLGFVSAPVSWRISKCAPALPKCISISPLPPPFFFFFFFPPPTPFHSLPSDVTPKLRHVNTNLHANTVQSVTGEYSFYLLLEHRKTFSFSLSPFTIDQRPLLHRWTPELLYTLLMNLWIVIQSYVNRKDRGALSLSFGVRVYVRPMHYCHEGFLAWACSNW